MEERESVTFYRGGLNDFRKEIRQLEAALMHLGFYRIPQWEHLLRDYKSVLRELEELKQRQQEGATWHEKS